MIRRLILVLLWTIAMVAQMTASASAVQRETETVVLNRNEAELYPRREAVSFQELERLADGIGVRLILRSDMPGFSQFEVAVSDGPFVPTGDNTVEIRFTDNHTPDIQTNSTRIRAKDGSGKLSREYGIAVNYYPKELYAESGKTAPGYVIVQESDVDLAGSRVEDWIIDRTTAEDIAFARETWGSALERQPTPGAKARELARAILDALEPHQGIPSDLMRAAPFEQYRRAVSGKDHVWCGNLADIFVQACAAFDIPARKIGMNRILSKKKGYSLMLAEGHVTTEIFDEALNRWVWIDLTFSMLGMELAEYGPVNMAEFQRYLNDPVLAKGLRACVYDPKAHSEKTVPALESDSRSALLNYFKRDQIFRYKKRVSK
jgi:hypothetical protein